MVAIYSLDRIRKTNQLRLRFPKFVRDSIFEDVDKVEVEASRDSRGQFIIIRPLKNVQVEK